MYQLECQNRWVFPMAWKSYCTTKMSKHEFQTDDLFAWKCDLRIVNSLSATQLVARKVLDQHWYINFKNTLEEQNVTFSFGMISFGTIIFLIFLFTIKKWKKTKVLSLHWVSQRFVTHFVNCCSEFFSWKQESISKQSVPGFAIWKDTNHTILFSVILIPESIELILGIYVYATNSVLKKIGLQLSKPKAWKKRRDKHGTNLTFTKFVW